MADQYSVKIGDGPSWQISADEYADLVRHKSLVDGLQNELKAAQATIRSLTAVVEQAEAASPLRHTCTPDDPDSAVVVITKDDLMCAACLAEPEDEAADEPDATYTYVAGWARELKAVTEERDELRVKCEAYSFAFSTQYEQMVKAVELWRAQDQARRSMTWPDLAELLRWLLDRSAERDGLQQIVDGAGWPGWDGASRSEAIIQLIRERDLAKQNAEAVAVYADERQRERDEARADRDELLTALREANDNRAGMLARFGIVRDERDEARQERDNIAGDAVDLARQLQGVSAELTAEREKVEALRSDLAEARDFHAQFASDLDGRLNKALADNGRLSDEVARLNATIVRLTNGGSIDG